MDPVRKIAMDTVAQMKPAVVEQLAAAKQGWTLYGLEKAVLVNGCERKMREYASGLDKAPAYFDIHGGGFAWGTMEDGNAYCQLLAKTLGWNVYSLDYPLSPENVFPSQIDYLLETIDYMVTHAEQFGILPSEIYVGGRSAGATLVAALCIKTAEQNTWHFKAQVLDHPWLDLKGVILDAERNISQEANPMDMLRLMAAAYASEEERAQPLCSPILADGTLLKRLPPAIIQTCELDSLRPDSDMYAKKLESAGIPVIYRVADNAIHGFTEYDIPGSEEGRLWLIESLRKLTD